VKRLHFWFQALIAASVTAGVVMLISTVHAQASIPDPEVTHSGMMRYKH
jgi:hypothetical protein